MAEMKEVFQTAWFLTGPTAVGKSETSLQLAEKLNAEIISLDSMAIYRGMDIGTAKPSQADRQRVPHHLIDILAPHEEFNIADYVSAAESACQEILDRQRIPLFVGGTGLYLRSLLRGVFEGPPADWELRRQLENEEIENGPGHLHRRLQELDSESAQRLHPNDQRRVIRALEVALTTGQPLSQMQQQEPLPVDQRPQHVYWLSPPRDWLRERIDRRVVQMFDDGLVEEVQQLTKISPPLSQTAKQALGYKETIEHLEGKATLPEAIETIQTRTRQFAKRQHTWFRNLEECTEWPITGDENSGQLAEQIFEQSLS